MTRIGLTGGIGSGKTTVARVFKTLDVPVFEADAEGRRVLKEDADVIRAVTGLFGPGVLRDGCIDRAVLASIVFQDPAALKELNAIVHPAVRKGFRRWADVQRAPYVIMEAAVMAENVGHQAMDQVIVVSAPEGLRIKRVMARDQAAEASVRSRIANQVSEEVRLGVAHHVILNDDNRLVIPQVLAVHAALLNFAKR